VTALVDSEALQLPPINFHVARDRPIAEVFRAIRRGDQAWDAAVDGLVVQEFDKARIPHLHKGANRRAYQDGRGLVFLAAHPSPATAPTARHPTTRTWRRPPATCYAVRSGSAAPSARASITMYSLRVTGGSTRSSFSAPERGPDDPSIPTSTSTPTMLCGGKNWPLPRYLGLRPPDLITRDYPH
jgi:hypothetical protein